MKTYISGPITNNPNYEKQFNNAARRLRSQGISVFDPTERGVRPGWKWQDYMREDLKALLTCRAIYMLKGWRRSKGARLERKVAKKLGYLIMYEK